MTKVSTRFAILVLSLIALAAALWLAPARAQESDPLTPRLEIVTHEGGPAVKIRFHRVR